MNPFFEQFKKNAVKKKSEDDAEMSEAEAAKPGLPWVEKYRPKRVKDVVYQNEVVSVLSKCLDGKDLPNLLFYGPPGTGKTSTILAMSRELFGNSFSDRVLEMNASDDRGIQVVRDKIKRFAQQAVSGRRKDGSPCPPFKLVILDEADSMTKDAQSALRRLMEKECASTRFCIICNYISRIIEPIASRCSKFRFKALKQELLVDKLRHIADVEGVKVEDDLVLEEIVNMTEGDMRKAITTLQTAFRWNGVKRELTVDNIYEISGLIPTSLIENIISVCKQQSFEKLEKCIMELLYDGYSASRFLNQLHDWVVSESTTLTDRQRSEICEAVADAESNLLNGANETLQVFQVSSIVMQQMSKS